MILRVKSPHLIKLTPRLFSKMIKERNNLRTDQIEVRILSGPIPHSKIDRKPASMNSKHMTESRPSKR